MSSSIPTSPTPHLTKKRKLDEVEAGLSIPPTGAPASPANRTPHATSSHLPITSLNVQDLGFILGAIEGADAPKLREYVITQIHRVIAQMRTVEKGSVEADGGISGEGVEAIMNVNMREGLPTPMAASHHHNVESEGLTLDPSPASSQQHFLGPKSTTLLSSAYADRSAGSREMPSSYITSHISIPASSITTNSATERPIPTFTSPTALSNPTTLELSSALILVFKDFAPHLAAIQPRTHPIPTHPISVATPHLRSMSSSVNTTPKTKRSTRSTSAPPVSSPPSRQLATPGHLVPPSPPREDEEELHCTRCHLDFHASSRRSSIPPCVIEHDWEKRERKDGTGSVWRYRCCGYEFESSTGGDAPPTDPNGNSDAGLYCFVGRHATDTGAEVGRNMNTFTCDELGCWVEEGDE
ncbi:hypothetical protein FRB94_009143 [Tulasnella sp. JGI-2019a]|nr:hypothetical protein FRB94_009143 [Tulasnella sp. JGI-2019a]